MAQLSIEMIRQIQTVAELYLEREGERLDRVAAARAPAAAPARRARAPQRNAQG